MVETVVLSFEELKPIQELTDKPIAGFIKYKTEHAEGLPGWFSHKIYVLFNGTNFSVETKLDKSPDIESCIQMILTIIKESLK